MTTSAAENLAGTVVEKKEEKAEKRRALGRGLESLLPGPRVVPSTQHPVPGAETPGVGDGAGEQQVPHFVRNDNGVTVRASDEMDATRSGAPAPHDEAAEVISIQAMAMPGNMVANIAIDLIEKNQALTQQARRRQ